MMNFTWKSFTLSCLIGFLIGIGLGQGARSYLDSDMYFDGKKEYIIEHINEFDISQPHYENDKAFFTAYIDDEYYSDVSVVNKADGSWYVIFWSDREKMKTGDTWHNFQWEIFSDCYFSLDDSELDTELITLLNQKIRVTNQFTKVFLGGRS